MTDWIGTEELPILSSKDKSSWMKFVLTTLRGKVVNRDSLVAALKNRNLSAALGDVTDPEPLSQGHLLWDVPDLHITPWKTY
ncbi:uncharacterized protein N7498_000175 [Penicillium cinerascens]|uniref:D-isomer specific 2-hydroxyacid dehydrogenase NAD-binding domain-containing protein n=1 Tax=Penicillium cinerascens TaxID=70096 RepID=A0A9W9TD28_9EURO|nr:uncharacterized protein N7498_000175 [Penicillium cinerascens]KAJ5218076.1 hypothetical protein N7498_000175 [Penicillium cinerascens]